MITYRWKCTVLHCNHLGNTWKPLVLMTRHFDYCPSASEGDNQSVWSSAPVVSRCFPGGYIVKLYISRGRLAWWLLTFLHSDCNFACCTIPLQWQLNVSPSTVISFWPYAGPLELRRVVQWTFYVVVMLRSGANEIAAHIAQKASTTWRWSAYYMERKCAMRTCARRFY